MNKRVPTVSIAAALVAFAVISVTMVAPVSAGSDQTPRTLGWQDLLPPPVEFDDPLTKLTPDQLFNLSSVIVMRRLKAEGSVLMTEERTAKLETSEKTLTESGIDIDDLLAQRERVKEARRAQSEVVVDALDGQTIRMPGYVLPLEFDGTKVREFLLVPFVGACIHTPPPPANQIVHVRPETSFESDGLFQAVWVTGNMSVGASKQSLFFVDGSSDIAIGYSLQASSVEAYSN
jgi:hypothetical protein